MDPPAKSNKPPSDSFRQQKLKAWHPIMTPWKVIILFAIIGVAFVATGTTLLSKSNDIFQMRTVYDGANANPDCTITVANAGLSCIISFNITEEVSGPLYVYYELDKFYQNHRRYVSSVDWYQLDGESQTQSSLETNCVELVKNGSQILNPCGLIANSYFTDIITLDTAASSPDSLTLDESSIAWPSDHLKFAQPSGFAYAKVTNASATCASVHLPSNCRHYYDSSEDQSYLFYYPDEDTTQYLYETYPELISPIDGVTNEHFQVWMRPAALPNFRKLYGKIDGHFKKGDLIVFKVIANFEVNSFDGSKAIVISTIGEFGGQNPYLGVAYIVVGALSLLFGGLFAMKQLLAPRPYADIALLNWE